MNKKQAHFLRDTYKVVTKMQSTNEVIIVLPNREIPEGKLMLDAIYIARLQKERLEK